MLFRSRGGGLGNPRRFGDVLDRYAHGSALVFTHVCKGESKKKSLKGDTFLKTVAILTQQPAIGKQRGYPTPKKVLSSIQRTVCKIVLVNVPDVKLGLGKGDSLDGEVIV